MSAVRSKRSAAEQGQSDTRPLSHTFRCAYCRQNKPLAVGWKKAARGRKCGECL
jgi:hypothetical protein